MIDVDLCLCNTGRCARFNEKRIFIATHAAQSLTLDALFSFKPIRSNFDYRVCDHDVDKRTFNRSGKVQPRYIGRSLRHTDVPLGQRHPRRPFAATLNGLAVNSRNLGLSEDAIGTGSDKILSLYCHRRIGADVCLHPPSARRSNGSFVCFQNRCSFGGFRHRLFKRQRFRVCGSA